ncbi:DUF2238 domain-containing protein [Deefgea rivuli]|uniref:DUF2238 domain-containing protein n=1 Tax=Deefgea rivuli TaxID=400948 RepID=UPI0004871002|nr:DUF2238 domain-containing protein [Deefgea rivuli]
MEAQSKQLHIALLVVLLMALAVSAWQPYERMTWALEVFPIVIALPVMLWTYKKFPLTDLLYCGIFLHALVLILGGTYTYARVPLGFSLQEWFELSRNPYDKIGHFFQGLVPALIAREILLRQQIVQGKKMLNFIVVSIVLAISASYELIEWAAALMLGQGADEFLGTQGDPWDTQSDMFFALLGAISALLIFAPWQDAQLRRMAERQKR